MTTRPPGRLLAILGGVLLSLPAFAHAAPEAGPCDTIALEQALAAAQRQVATLQAANQALSSANQALTAETERLRADPKAAQATIDSFVSRLFGQPADGNVAAAARAAALAELTVARARTPGDHRLRFAQRSFEQGEQAMRRQEPGRAVHEFRETYEMAVRILGERQRPPAPQVKNSD
ncbi:MAG TPA: hypothetical protein VGD07_17920 [Methylomirabilota bacterium]